VDFGTLIKTPQESSDLNKRYSPGEFVNALSTLVTGNLKAHLFSTSHSEGQNFTVEMQLLRFTRLTNSYSNKLSHLINRIIGIWPIAARKIYIPINKLDSICQQ